MNIYILTVAMNIYILTVDININNIQHFPKDGKSGRYSNDREGLFLLTYNFNSVLKSRSWSWRAGARAGLLRSGSFYREPELTARS